MDYSLSEAVDLSAQRMIQNYAGIRIIGINPQNDRRKLLSSDQCCQAEFDRTFEFSHDFTELCIGIRGALALQLQDEIFEVNEGDIAFIVPGTYHNELAVTAQEYIALWFGIGSNRIMVHLTGRSRESGFYLLDGESLRMEYEIGIPVNDIVMDIHKLSPYYHDLTKSFIMQLLINTLRKISQKRGEIHWKQSLVMEVKEYINTSFTKHIKLSDISHEICISVNHLNTIFKSVTGKTIIQYIDDLRISRAAHLLKNDNSTISAIAAELGFCDQYHFSKVFKKKTGQTPSEYRQKGPAQYRSIIHHGE